MVNSVESFPVRILGAGCTLVLALFYNGTGLIGVSTWLYCKIIFVLFLEACDGGLFR